MNQENTVSESKYQTVVCPHPLVEWASSKYKQGNFVFSNGRDTMVYTSDGKRHRLDGPAEVSPHRKCYYVNGELNDHGDLPACTEYQDGSGTQTVKSVTFYKNGKVIDVDESSPTIVKNAHHVVEMHFSHSGEIQSVTCPTGKPNVLKTLYMLRENELNIVLVNNIKQQVNGFDPKKSLKLTSESNISSIVNALHNTDYKELGGTISGVLMEKEAFQVIPDTLGFFKIDPSFYLLIKYTEEFLLEPPVQKSLRSFKKNDLGAIASGKEKVKVENGKVVLKEIFKSSLSNELHCETGPARIEFYDHGVIKKEEYYLNNKLSRVNAPAVIYYNRLSEPIMHEYFHNNMRHNENGAAIQHLKTDAKEYLEIYEMSSEYSDSIDLHDEYYVHGKNMLDHILALNDPEVASQTKLLAHVLSKGFYKQYVNFHEKNDRAKRLNRVDYVRIGGARQSQESPKQSSSSPKSSLTDSGIDVELLKLAIEKACELTGYKPTAADLQAFREVFESAKNDKDFKVFSKNPTSADDQDLKARLENMRDEFKKIAVSCDYKPAAADIKSIGELFESIKID